MKIPVLSYSIYRQVPKIKVSVEYWKKVVLEHPYILPYKNEVATIFTDVKDFDNEYKYTSAC